MKRHPSAPLAPNLPPKVARRNPIPNIIDPPTNDDLLEQLEQQKFKNMLSTQVGFGVTEMTSHGEQTEIFDKFTSKSFNAFVILEPVIAVPVFFLDNYTMIMHLLLKPLPKPMKISFVIKPMLSRSTSLRLSFYNTERLKSSVITTPVTITSY